MAFGLSPSSVKTSCFGATTFLSSLAVWRFREKTLSAVLRIRRDAHDIAQTARRDKLQSATTFLSSCYSRILASGDDRNGDDKNVAAPSALRAFGDELTCEVKIYRNKIPRFARNDKVSAPEKRLSFRAKRGISGFGYV